VFDDYYRGKRVLVTGHNGFKGSWLSLWLRELGAEVHGLSLAPEAGDSLHALIPDDHFASQAVVDIRDYDATREAIAAARPQVLLHLAAQPIVRLSYEQPLETLASNVMGTAHVLEAVRTLALDCPLLVVSSDKCYDNREWEYAYRECDALGGHDVYSMSKGGTELVAQSWRRSFFLPDERLGPLASARAGNVIGGGDYAPDRIVPDCVRSLAAGEPITVRRPDAVRPWQHVLECLGGYLALVAELARHGRDSGFDEAFNFGPDPGARQPVRRLVEEVLKAWPGEWIDASDGRGPHEATLLTLAIDKAAARLDWRPVWSFEEGVRATVDWYRTRHRDGASDAGMLEFTRAQIRDYAATAAARGLPWAAGEAPTPHPTPTPPAPTR